LLERVPRFLALAHDAMGVPERRGVIDSTARGHENPDA
jgi:hypothetical protein